MKHLTYTTDCMRRITDKDTGEQRIARFVEERPVSVSFFRETDANDKPTGRRFWKGALVS